MERSTRSSSGWARTARPPRPRWHGADQRVRGWNGSDAAMGAGSSGGRTRMIRIAHFEHPWLVPMATAAWDGGGRSATGPAAPPRPRRAGCMRGRPRAPSFTGPVAALPRQGSSTRSSMPRDPREVADPRAGRGRRRGPRDKGRCPPRRSGERGPPGGRRALAARSSATGRASSTGDLRRAVASRSRRPTARSPAPTISS